MVDEKHPIDGEQFADLPQTKPSPRKPATGYSEVICRILHETEKVVLVEISNQGENSDTDTEYWFPLSQTGYIYRPLGFIKINPDFTDIIHVSTWLINKRGIEL